MMAHCGPVPGRARNRARRSRPNTHLANGWTRRAGASAARPATGSPAGHAASARRL